MSSPSSSLPYKLCKPEHSKLPKSFSSNFLNINPLTAITSPRNSELFSKTKSSHKPNTKGQPSVVLYRKSDKLPYNKFELNFKDSGYVTDGGINKKRERYSNIHSPKHTFISNSTKNNKQLMNSKSMRSIKKQPNANLILMTMNSHHKLLSPSKAHINVASPKIRTSSAVTSPSNKKYTVSPSNQSSIKAKKKKTKGGDSTNNVNNVVSSNNSNVNQQQQQQQYNEEDKLNQQQLLIERNFINILRDSQLSRDININNDRRREEVERKRRKLNDNGVSLSNIDKILNGESPSQSESNNNTALSNNNNNNIIHHPKIKQIHLKHKPSQPYSTSNTNNNNNNSPSKLSSPSRQILKPKIDNLEYYQQIQQHRKFNNNNNSKPKTKKSKSNNTKISIDSSFRESSSKHNKQPHISSSNSLLDSKLLCGASENEYKKTHRSQEDIQKYMYIKRKNEIINEENKIKQKNKRILSNFQELFNLSNVRRCFPKTTKHKLTKHKHHHHRHQHQQYKYMDSNMNISTIIDENILKDELFNVHNILHYNDDAVLLLPFHNANANHHSDSNMTIRSEHAVVDNNVNDDTKKHTIKKANKNSISSSNKHSEDNEQIKEEDLLTSERNVKLTVTSKYERTPKPSMPNNNNNNTNTPSIITKTNQSNKPINNNINNVNINIHHIDDNIRTTSDIVVTKEMNIPSLSHSYNTNPNNQHTDIIIEPRCVLNLVEIIKIIIQRKVFSFLYQLYITKMIHIQYYNGISLLIAILKYNAFRQLENYAIYNSYYITLMKMFSPFIRTQFEFFINQLQYKKKVEFLMEFLTKRFKLTCLARIHFYGNIRTSQRNYITNRFRKLVRPWLMEAFDVFVYNVNSKYGDSYNSDDEDDDDDDTMYLAERRMKTFLYRSLSSEESYFIDPNSEGSRNLHNLIGVMKSFDDKREEEFDGENAFRGLKENVFRVIKENAKEKVWKRMNDKQSEDIKHVNSIKKSDDKDNGNILVDSIEVGNDEGHHSEQSQVSGNDKVDKVNEVSSHELKQQQQHVGTEQDISVDKEHSNIDWVINLPSDTKSKDNETRITNEKPKLEIIIEPSKETLLKDINNTNTYNNITSPLIHSPKIDLPFTPPPHKSKDEDEPPINPFTQLDMNALAEAITNDIINNMVHQELTKPKLLPHKHFISQTNPNNNNNLQLSQSGSLTSSSLNNLTNSDKQRDSSSPKHASSYTNIAFYSNINDNILASYSLSSVFNRTLKEKKKQHAITLYNQQIGPQLIQLIKHEIIINYSDILNNISSPLRNIPEGLMTSLVLENTELLKKNYRLSQINKEISDILNKQRILNAFAPINKRIRLQTSKQLIDKTSKLTGKPLEYAEQEYDDMLNNCLIDATIELINKERKYGDAGEPLPWSNRTRDIAFKYDKSNPHKLASYIEQQLTLLLNEKMGLINDNYDYLYPEQVNIERDRKLIENIKHELKEDEPQWTNLEIQETQLKLEVTDMILEQCYNEVVEILEHIQFSRKRPDLYQYKSIYACEEMPRLSFQMTTTNDGQEDDSDVINI